MDDGTILYGENVTHQYSNEGDYNVILTVKDNGGIPDTENKTIHVEKGLTADFTYEPTNPDANQTVYFNSTSHTPVGMIINWSWDFGDGNIAYGEFVTHQYLSNGTYGVNHTVTDDDDITDSIIKTINVGMPTVIQFYTGWNLITIPVQNNFTASTLLDYIPESVTICGFDAINQEYKCYSPGDPPPYNFNISDGYGYFIWVNQPNYVTFSDLTINSVSIPLYIGYNLIGWFQEYNTTAGDLLAAIPGAVTICSFDAENQEYKCYSPGDPPPYNFNITKGMGFFLWVDQVSTWDGTDSVSYTHLTLPTN